MRILYVTDLHGDIEKYEKVLQLANDNQIKCIINGGDMLPKHCDLFVEQKEFICNYLQEYFSRLKDNGIEYLCMLGNDDLGTYDELFDEVVRNNNVHNIGNRKVTINGYDFIGMNYVLDYPFGLKDRVVIEDGFTFEEQKGTAIYTKSGHIVEIPNWEEFARENLNKMREILYGLPTSIDASKTVYIMHMPPAELGLGENLQSLSLGSREIYNFINQRNPLLTLHGHVHESPNEKDKIWHNKINETDCIQPGQTEIGSDELVYVLIDLEKKMYERKTCKIKDIIK